jgi:hypothetical protein
LRCNPFRDIAIATEAPLVAILEQFRCKRRPVNVHHFRYALTAQLFNLTQLPTELLLEYDQHIVRHTQRLNERRITRGEEPIVWKYFRDPQSLLAALNGQVATYNTDRPDV